jgi:hypothetical protein
MRFSPGDTAVRRLLHADGRLGPVFAGIVVRDDADGLLLWIDADAEALTVTRLDGRPTRKLPYAEELRLPLIHTPTIWSELGGALVLTPPASPWSVLHFYDRAGAFTGWYVNLEQPAARWWGGVDVLDHALDILVAPDRTWRWKDEDELADHTGIPGLWDEVGAAQIRAAGERAVALVEAGAFPFDGTFRDFRPAWAPARMPWWWDQVRTAQPPTG